MNHDASLIRSGEVEALEFFTRLTTFYEQHAVFHLQKQDLHQGQGACQADGPLLRY
jgi:hypothetical protein